MRAKRGSSRRIPIAGFCLLALIVPVVAPLAQDADAGGPGAAGAGEERSIVEQWGEVLRYGIDSEVLKVVKAVGEAGERSLDGELLEVFLHSLSTEVRSAVLEVFAARESRAAEGAAVALLRQEELEDPALQVALIRYLSAIGSADAEPALLRLVEEADRSGTDERVVESALLALGEVGSPTGGDLLLEKLRDPRYPETLKPELILALGKIQYAPAVEELLSIVADGGAERTWRMYAATALGEIGDPRAVDPLKELFREQDSLIKVYAASALARFGMGEVEELLHQGLRDSNERVRAAAARALANPDARASVDILIYKARNDPAQAVRIEAIRALGRIASPRALEYLRELYAQKLAALSYREEALLALCEDNLPESLGVVAQVIEAEWSARDAKVVGFTARILSTQESTGLSELFGRLLTHPDVGVRIYALRGIARNRIAPLAGKVRELSEQDPHPAVRRTALSVLEQL